MENCTIYSHQLNFDKVVEIVKAKLPKAKIDYKDGGMQKSLVATVKGGLFSKAKTLTINYRQRANPSYKLDHAECGLTQNLVGMTGFVQSIPAQNAELKSKFLVKLQSANCEMPFMADPDINSDFEGVLKTILSELDAFVFTPPNKLFNGSDGQQFIDKNFGLIMDTNGNSTVQDISVVVDSKYHDQPAEEYTQEQLDRKEKSGSHLEKNGVKLNKNLPCTASSENTTLRNVNEVIDRTYALTVTAAKASGIPKPNLEKAIQDKRITGLSPRETMIRNLDSLDEGQNVYASWRYESLNTMLWALNLIPDLPYPGIQCDVQGVLGMVMKPTREEFDQQAKLRSKSEILDELDKIYRMNWACVDARIKGMQVEGDIEPGIVYERHYSLNWLTNFMNQEWDDVQTPT